MQLQNIHKRGCWKCRTKLQRWKMQDRLWIRQTVDVRYNEQTRKSTIVPQCRFSLDPTKLPCLANVYTRPRFYNKVERIKCVHAIVMGGCRVGSEAQAPNIGYPNFLRCRLIFDAVQTFISHSRRPTAKINKHGAASVPIKFRLTISVRTWLVT